MEKILLKELETDILTDIGAFRGIVPEWQQLLERSPGATPFQYPAWIIPWWEHFGQGELLVLVIRREGALVGLAPCFLHKALDRVTRQVSFIGIGNSDYLDAILDRRYASKGTEEIMNLLVHHAERWDECDLFDLPSQSPLLSAAAPAGFLAIREPLSTCPVIKLPESFDVYMNSLQSVHRRKARKGLRILENSGQLHLEMADNGTLGEYLGEFFKLYHAWWNRRGESGVLTDPEMEHFHREAVGGLWTAGILRLYRLSFNERPIALVYGFRRGDCFYSYLGAFDPDMEKFSPGVVVFQKIIEDCIRNGVREFNLLRGKERYKYLWGAQDTTTWRFRIMREERG